MLRSRPLGRTALGAGGFAGRWRAQSSVPSDRPGAFLPTASAGNILLSAARGTVSVVGTPGSRGEQHDHQLLDGQRGGGDAGTATLIGANVSLERCHHRDDGWRAHLTRQSPTITVSASGNVDSLDSLLDARTSGMTVLPPGTVGSTGVAQCKRRSIDRFDQWDRLPAGNVVRHRHGCEWDERHGCVADQWRGVDFLRR